MVLPTRLGLERGIHTKNGGQVVDHSRFIDDLIEACDQNDFLLARGFSTSEFFDPKVVVFGVQHETALRNGYTNPRMTAILKRIINERSVLVGDGAEGVPSVEKRAMYCRHPFYEFIGKRPITFIDNEKAIDAADDLAKGIKGLKEISASQRAREHLAPGLVRIASETNIAERVIAVMGIHHFITGERYILPTLEQKGINYALACPRTRFIPPGSNIGMDHEEFQAYYQKLLENTADAKFKTK